MQFLQDITLHYFEISDLDSFPIKIAETSTQPGKTATIEMYAPSSYNDTLTGETLSSVSEKSESYSNDGANQNDYTVSKQKFLPILALFSYAQH